MKKRREEKILSVSLRRRISNGVDATKAKGLFSVAVIVCPLSTAFLVATLVGGVPVNVLRVVADFPLPLSSSKQSMMHVDRRILCRLAC